MDTTIQYFVTALRKKKLTVSFAESMTCGLATYRLSNCSGTSDVLRGSIACYTPEMKMELLKVPKKIVEKYSCESMQVTALLAKHLERLVPADIYAAITGLASPGGSETKSKPVGTVFFCVYYKGKVHKLRKQFGGTPVSIKKKACVALYDFILSVI